MVMNGMLIVEEVVSHARVCISTFIFYVCSTQVKCFPVLHIYVNDQIFIIFTVLIEVQLKAVEAATHISWRLQNTNCKSDDNLEVGGNRVYQTDCKLAIGQTYTLECNSLGDGWWKSNHLVIENYLYCEYAKGKTLNNITITGNLHTS